MKIVKLTITAFLIASLIAWLLFTPQVNLNWSVDQKIMPVIEVEDGLVRLNNIRDFSYRSKTDFTPAYVDEEYQISKLKRAWYFLEHFDDNFTAPGHGFVTFEFEDNRFLTISIEIRKEIGENFSALKGMLRQYELMYVFGTERDILALRTNHRNHSVYMYPIKASSKQVELMFRSMLKRAKALQTEPEFYHTILSSCTTNLVAHTREISEEGLPLSLGTVLAGHSDYVIYELGLIDNSISFYDSRAKYKIDEIVRKTALDENFSVTIREHLSPDLY